MYGFAFFRPLPLINAITADISDKLNLEGGENISGTVFSYLTTLTKIGFALAAVVPYVVLEFLWGFDISLGIENSTRPRWQFFISIHLYQLLVIL